MIHAEDVAAAPTATDASALQFELLHAHCIESMTRVCGRWTEGRQVPAAPSTSLGVGDRDGRVSDELIPWRWIPDGMTESGPTPDPADSYSSAEPSENLEPTNPSGTPEAPDSGSDDPTDSSSEPTA